MLKLLGLFILVGGLWYGIGAAMTNDSKGAIIGVFIGIMGLLITWKVEGKKKHSISSLAGATIQPTNSPPPALWFYVIGNEKTGPVTAKEIINSVASGRIGEDTLVWSEDMPDWIPFSSSTLFYGSKTLKEPPPPPLSTSAAPVNAKHLSTNNKSKTMLIIILAVLIAVIVGTVVWGRRDWK